MRIHVFCPRPRLMHAFRIYMDHADELISALTSLAPGAPYRIDPHQVVIEYDTGEVVAGDGDWLVIDEQGAASAYSDNAVKELFASCINVSHQKEPTL